MNEIKVFKNEHFYLSNMFPVTIKYNGLFYKCVEAAYQANKSNDPAVWDHFTMLNGYEAKAEGRAIQKRLDFKKDWYEINVNLMVELVWIKFSKNHILAEKLLSTDSMEIVEGNALHDYFWGVCNGSGKNYLGKILMYTRERLQYLDYNTCVTFDVWMISRYGQDGE